MTDVNAPMQLPPILHTLSRHLAKHNARAVVVGGSVRDHFLGMPIKDYDIEVYGLEHLEQLVSILEARGSVNLVGRSFGVIKWTYNGNEYDVSFPRRESKVGSGHRGFDVSVDGQMTFAEAARRRDFTINAIGYDIAAHEFLDPFGGIKDLQEKHLKHIDDATFAEDPLRVYRAVQFAARFDLEIAEETFVLCKQMVDDGFLEELPKERIHTEWKKLLLKSPAPSTGFELMRRLGILERYFPELHAITGVPQSPKWHPEGDVWIHTMMALDVMAEDLETISEKLEMDEKEKLRFLFAVLCHDLGKASTTTLEYEDGTIEKWHETKQSYTTIPHFSLLTSHSIRAIGHERAGIKPARTLLHRLTDAHGWIESILPLVEHHLKPSQLYAGRAKAPAIRRLATKVNIEDLVRVARADFLGRATREVHPGTYPAGEWLMEQAHRLHVTDAPMKPLLQGRDLMALGLIPSPQFRKILDAVYQEQIEGRIDTRDEAVAYVKSVLRDVEQGL